MSLAKLLDEAKRLETGCHFVELERLITANGLRLVAIAAAAVEMRHGVEVSMGRANGRWCEWGERAEMVLNMLEENLAAFDAVVRGSALAGPATGAGGEGEP
ncbi:MAG: hypothetical protein Q8P41_31865 [Pseudomonadota bacterium]|nr:hypothetical protein [Pseudomonadota bacterium]